MYIPVIVGDGLVKYRKQSNFYNVITRYKDDGYVKVTNNGNETSTYIYIPSDLGFDNDTYYMYFDVTYNIADPVIGVNETKSKTTITVTVELIKTPITQDETTTIGLTINADPQQPTSL